MAKLNIEAVTGMKPEEFGLHPNTDFVTDKKGNVTGIATADGGMDYDSSPALAETLGETIDQVNEEQGEAN